MNKKKRREIKINRVALPYICMYVKCNKKIRNYKKIIKIPIELKEAKNAMFFVDLKV